MPLPPGRPGLTSFVAAVAVAATCLVLSPSALAGDPSTSIKINEVESEGLADFIELVNISATPTDVSALVLKDNDNTRTLAIPAGTSVPAGGFLAVNTDVPGGFAMDASDMARVFLPNGTTQVDAYTWTKHAATTFGRCPDGTGAFVTTGAVTKGTANSCPPPLVTQPWPGSPSVTTVDQANVLGADVSGLDYEGSGTATPGVLWAVDNGNNLLLRLLWDGTQWVSDTANGWSTGKPLRFPDGVGKPDSEGVTLTDAGAAGGVYVSSERDTTNNTVSRPSVLRYDVSGAGATLTATREWNLTADLPAVGANAGAESVEWVPDTSLVGFGFVDQTTGAAYNPATYPNHGTGLFFVGLEANGIVYAYALDQTSSSFTRVATLASGFSTFGALHWEPATNQLWVVCDNNCNGRSRVFQVDTQAGATQGSFVPVADYDRPTDMPNLNNEGFTITPASECVGGSKPVFWADDGNDGGHVLRAGTIPCSRPPTNAADFNGDGFADLVVGVPDEDVGTVANAGAVSVIYGSASGLAGTGTQHWTQSSTGIVDTAETDDHFGAAVAVGDVNGDGRSDLIVGVPDEDLASVADAGAVHVLLGSPTGLTAAGSQFWHQNVSGVSDTAEAGDRFGAALAAADHDGDGKADLTIGAPTEDLSSVTDAGVVHLLRGDAGGVTATGSQLWHQNSAGIADIAENGDRFGAALAAGQLGDSAQADLAIGAPGEAIGANGGAGAVHVLLGGASALTATGSQLWHQNVSGVADAAEPGDAFGSALAVGDVGGSSMDDLAIGAALEDLGAVSDAGVVHLLPGGTSGPTAAGSQLWHQNVSGIADSAENGDRFGQALAIGNFGGSRNELAVGVPHEAVGAAADAGAVHVLPGTVSFLTATGSLLWHQDSPGITDKVEAGDMFGASLAASPFKGSATQSGLAIGAPGESVGTVLGAGAVNAIYGSASGLASAGNQIWSQNSPSVLDVAETDDHFGAALG